MRCAAARSAPSPSAARTPCAPAPHVQELYKNEPELMEQLKGPRGPAGYQNAQRIEYAFKIRDKAEPKAWSEPVNLVQIPAREDIPEGVAGNMKSSWEAFTGKLTGKTEARAERRDAALDDAIPDDMAGKADSQKKKKGLAGLFNF